jgi:membrane complex biogenesis BtpA family protein
MLWTEELFGVKKPILAMLHLDALPGDPRFRRGTQLGEIVEHARADLHALQDGGVDGIIFSNEFSFPYQRKMDMVTPAAMAYIIGALRSEIRVPFGVDAISDGAACLELAAAVGASYVRGLSPAFMWGTEVCTTTTSPPCCAARPPCRSTI